MPVPEVLDRGGDDQLAWSLTAAVPGIPLDGLCTSPAPAVLVRDGHVSALVDFEFARMGPPDLELISVIRALDVETRLGVPRPPLLAWLAEDYPELFAAPDLDRRLWQYAIAYTIRHIIFWPPDRAEADGLDPGHPLHTLRRLINDPLPLPTGDISGLASRHDARPPAPG